ncbi:MAG: glycosyltransferase, partial [Candidatus Dormibacteraeota bacterium]|nr:glycosyltransferase [Candidatus Dormibacteraeota bacterium]
VVNDGSTDSTSTVAADAGVTCITQSNVGRTRARDRGWRSSLGEIVVFLDDDVVPETDAIDRMVRGLDTADGVGARIMPMSTTQLIAHYMHVDGIVSHYVDGDRALWLVTAAAAFRRDALERVDGFDLAFHQAGEDVDLTLRMAACGSVLRVDAQAVVYHEHRARLRDLWGTCNRYGRAYNMLASRHVVHRAERQRAARARANPRAWLRQYQRYRTEASVQRSLAFLALHASVGVPYALGLMQSAARSSSVGSRGNVELIGHRAPALLADVIPLDCEPLTDGAPVASL